MAPTDKRLKRKHTLALRELEQAKKRLASLEAVLSDTLVTQGLEVSPLDAKDVATWVAQPCAVRELLAAVAGATNCIGCGSYRNQPHGVVCPIMRCFRLINHPAAEHDIQLRKEVDARLAALNVETRTLFDLQRQTIIDASRLPAWVRGALPPMGWRRYNEPDTMGMMPPLTPPSPPQSEQQEPPPPDSTVP